MSLVKKRTNNRILSLLAENTFYSIIIYYNYYFINIQLHVCDTNVKYNFI